MCIPYTTAKRKMSIIQRVKKVLIMSSRGAQRRGDLVSIELRSVSLVRDCHDRKRSRNDKKEVFFITMT